ncbi:MAG: site-specific integrase [Candidatus Nitrosopolaris sp.]|jgi:integrase
MTLRLETILKRLDWITNQSNLKTVKEFHQFFTTTTAKELYHSNLLQTIIFLALYLNNKKFGEVNKELLLSFLNHKFENGKWVTRKRDVEDKWITTFNHNVALCRIFFRWLYNPGKEKEDWETPTWFKIKNIKTKRKSPYKITQIWTREELLSIVNYERNMRNRAIFTMSWDMNARNHEITSLKIGDIQFKDRYAEGIIPFQTKTGGGPIMLTMSYPYARSWLNKHPLKHKPNAPFFYNLQNFKSLKPPAIWKMVYSLRLIIKNMVEDGTISGKEKEKMEFLLSTKAWSPYCMFRHSSLTADADTLPEFVLKKKARLTMDSKQSNRYLANIMGQDIKNKMLQNAGIPIEEKQKPQAVVQVCQHCNYINTFETEMCESCSRPVNQIIFEKLKQQQDSNTKDIMDERLQKMKNEMQVMFESYKQDAKKLMDLEAEKNRQNFRQQLSDAVKRTGKKPEMVLSEEIDEFILNSNPKDLEESFMRLNPVYKSLMLDEVRALKNEIEEGLHQHQPNRIAVLKKEEA